jgi:hypothetical protein
MLSSSYYINRSDFIKILNVTNDIISIRKKDGYYEFDFKIDDEIINSISFSDQKRMILAIKTSKSNILEKIITKLNHVFQCKLEELNIADEYFKEWFYESSQILECNIFFKHTDSQIKLSDINLKENKFFLNNITQNKIIRMMFTLKGYEDYLITVKYNGRIGITPDPPNNDKFYEILDILFNIKVIAE